jgi:hypothetical protein
MFNSLRRYHVVPANDLREHELAPECVSRTAHKYVCRLYRFEYDWWSGVLTAGFERSFELFNHSLKDAYGGEILVDVLVAHFHLTTRRVDFSAIRLGRIIHVLCPVVARTRAPPKTYYNFPAIEVCRAVLPPMDAVVTR